MHILRGYAVCFNDVEELCGEDTLFRPDAFMQSVRRPVSVRFGGHEARDIASTVDGTLSLFQDDYGLGFEARLPNSPAASRMVQDVVSRRFQGCSGQFQYAKTQRIGNGANSVLCVQASRVEHVAIVAAPVFRNTGIWSADVPRSQLPTRLRELASHWHRGNAVAAVYEGILVRCCPTAQPARKAPALPVSPKAIQKAKTPPHSAPVASIPAYQMWVEGRPHYFEGAHPPVLITPFGGFL